MENSERLDTAVKEKRWEEVTSLLRNSNYSGSVVEQFITACEHYDVIWVEWELLFTCTTQQLDRLLTLATTKREWYYVDKVLKAGGSHETRVWVIEQACNSHIDSWELCRYILPHINDDFLSRCSTQQLDCLLTAATTRGHWIVVDLALKAGVNQDKQVWVIEQACINSDIDDWDLDTYILPHVNDDFLSHCTTQQLDRLLTLATIKRWWFGVYKVLKAGGSHETRVWVIDQACNSDIDSKKLDSYILPHVNDDFLSCCITQQLDYLLTAATTTGHWKVVDKLLKAGGSQEKRVCVIEQAYNAHIGSSALDCYILPHVNNDFLSRCNTQQMDCLLTAATRRRHWIVVDSAFKAGGSHETRVWVIEQACNSHIDSWELCRYILPHINDDFLSRCSTQQLDCLLTAATTTGHWIVVGLALKADVSHDKQVWVIEQACINSDIDDWDLDTYILPHVNDDFLSHCTTQQLDRLLTLATIKRWWFGVYKVLKAGGSHETRVWVIEQACNSDIDCKKLDRYILPHVNDDFLSRCSTQQLDYFRTLTTIKRWWNVVDRVLKAGGSCEQRVWVIEQACNSDIDSKKLDSYILPHINDEFLSRCSTQQMDYFLTAATTRGHWEVVDKVLKAGGSHEKRVWVIEQACKTAHGFALEHYILPHCSDDHLESVLTHFVTRGMVMSVAKVLERGVSDSSHTWALSGVCKGLTVKYTYTTVMSKIDTYLKTFNSDVEWLNNYPLSSNELSREAQSVVLRFALQQHKWDVISRASLSQVWEQVRRHLFREAVYRRKWTLVQKWADHTLYDDERWWALEEAYKHKQWDVMLQLADHGLTEIELMRVRYRLAKHADWDVVLRMIGRGVDVTEVRDVVESTMISRKTKTTTDRATQEAFKLRWWQLCKLEEKLTRDSATRLKLPSTARQWDTVLFHLHRHPRTASVPSRSQPSKTFGGLLLQRAIQQRAWHVVMHLVRLGIGTDQLDSLLTDMMRRRQWGVCRVLLEQRVRVQSCLSALSVFMEMNQWTLVARVMEFMVDDVLKRQVEQLALDRNVGSLVWQCVRAMCRYGMCVGDAVRLKVMQLAMERREGSVVGECISTMQHYRLSVKEREELFQQAISRGVLQALKPLVDEKNESETQHRDAAMLAAIEQRQWDVVDCCQFQGADIDMKDVHGETPLNREVRKKDMNTVEWKAVEELVVRGADPNVLDKDCCSVLNRAIKAKEWDIVRLLIEYHGDIHMSAKSDDSYNSKPTTPLQFLIDQRQGEIIHHTLIWCPDQAKGVNDEGETTLHAIALDKKPQLMYYQIVRGVNPLTLTKLGHSVLFYAVQNKHCPQRMVGECIKLGFSTHQPRLTQWTTVDMTEVVTRASLNDSAPKISSPFLLAVVRGMPVVAHMLYESGSSSYSELLHMYTRLLDLSDNHTEDGGRLLERMQPWYSDQYKQRYDTFMDTLTTFLPYLREMASTPRSLVSMCRLVISHCLTVRRRRERAVQDLTLTDGKKGIKYLLPLPDRMKDYLLFSDLTDPDYQWFLYGTLPPLKVKKKKQNSKAVRRQRQRGSRRT